MTRDWWYRMCKDARPPLKGIDIGLLNIYEKEEAVEENPGYNEAFQLWTVTLESLKIDPRILTSLPCLPSMTRVKHLGATTDSIFPTPEAMRDGDISDHLPPSLETIFIPERHFWPPWPYSDIPVTQGGFTGLVKAQQLSYSWRLRRI